MYKFIGKLNSPAIPSLDLFDNSIAMFIFLSKQSMKIILSFSSRVLGGLYKQLEHCINNT